MSLLLAGRLRLLELIGEGGSGRVWRAWDVATRHQVAAQLLTHRGPHRRPAIRHPHLLMPHEWLDHEPPVALMRLVRGGTTEQLLATHGALPADHVAVLLDQLLQGLAAVHDAGLVHRDVKPANLLLEPTGTGRPRLRLADFGLAAPVYAAAGRAGTAGYVAPDAGVQAHPSLDLYAAGVTAAELLTGRVARSARDLPRSRLRPVLAALVDPAAAGRPASATEALARLREIGVPDGAPWQDRAYPPTVPDRFAGARLRRLRRASAPGPRR